jgi:hypothetical protein
MVTGISLLDDGFREGGDFIIGGKMVPTVGIEPTRTQGPRDFKCENAIFSNPLILGRFSRNRSK